MTVEQPTINVYGANWCSDCRRTKKYLGEQRLHYNWFDIEIPGPEGEKNLDFVLKVNEEIYGKAKRKIPAVEVIKENGEQKLFVEPNNYELAEYLGIAKAASKVFYHVIIIGGGPAGLTASIYLARDGYDVLVIEQSTIGGQAFITNKLDNFPGFPMGITGGDFADNIRRQAERFGVEILSPQKVIRVTPCHVDETYKDCKFKTVTVQNGQEFNCIAILAATGSEYRQLVVPGSDTLLGVSIHYCATCDGYFYKNKRIFVIGGGNSAFEEALFLKEKFADHVTIVIRGNKPRASPVLNEKVQSRDGIDVMLNSEIIEVIGEDKLESIKVKHRDTEEIKEYHPDGIFVFIGLSPNTKFLSDVELDINGFIVTNNEFHSSGSGIFAAGDCRQGSTKQAVAAAGEGAAAAIMIRDFLS
ncbi:MAG: FAD-dependent oxidoreductase, partial [Candidatus Hodarchaeota archaeon]